MEERGGLDGARGYAGSVPEGTTRTSGLAIASVILATVGFFTLPVVASALAIFFGVHAKREIRRNPGLTGEGLAQAGTILGAVGLAVLAVFLTLVYAVL